MVKSTLKKVTTKIFGTTFYVKKLLIDLSSLVTLSLELLEFPLVEAKLASLIISSFVRMTPMPPEGWEPPNYSHFQSNVVMPCSSALLQCLAPVP